MSDTTNPKDLLGIKKAPLRLVPPALTIRAAEALALGAQKYGPYNWRAKDVRLTVYLEALQRHVLAYADRQDIDPESGASHLSHAAACLAIIFDAGALGRLIDDRFEAGPAAQLLAEQDRSKKEDPKLRSHRIVGEDGELVGKEWCRGECPTTLSHVMTSRGWEAVAPECGEDPRCGGDGQCEFHDDAAQYTELVEYGDEVARVVRNRDEIADAASRDGRNCGARREGGGHAHDEFCAHRDNRTDDEVLADLKRRYS